MPLHKGSQICLRHESIEVSTWQIVFQSVFPIWLVPQSKPLQGPKASRLVIYGLVTWPATSRLDEPSEEYLICDLSFKRHRSSEYPRENAGEGVEELPNRHHRSERDRNYIQFLHDILIKIKTIKKNQLVTQHFMQSIDKLDKYVNRQWCKSSVLFSSSKSDHDNEWRLSKSHRPTQHAGHLKLAIDTIT